MTLTPAVLQLKWRQRNAAIESAMRVFLALYAGPPLSTKELAAFLLPGGSRDDQKQVQTVLTKLAPWMGNALCERGGSFIAYGRKMQRWNWKGQNHGKSVEGQSTEGANRAPGEYGAAGAGANEQLAGDGWSEVQRSVQVAERVAEREVER